MTNLRPRTAEELRALIVRVKKNKATAGVQLQDLQADVRNHERKVKRWRNEAKTSDNPWSWSRAIGSAYLNPIAFFREHGAQVMMTIPFVVGAIPVIGIIIGLLFFNDDEVQPGFRIEAEGSVLISRGDSGVPLGELCQLAIGHGVDCEVRLRCGTWSHFGVYACREQEYTVDNGEGDSSTHYHLLATERSGSGIDFYFHEEEHKLSYEEGDVLWRLVLHQLTSYATTEISGRVVLNGERLRTRCTVVLEDPVWSAYHITVNCADRGQVFDDDVACQTGENGLECWEYGASSFVMAEEFAKAIVRDGSDVFELWIFE